jgi:Aspartyl/Asparaginyl beta-hydroxylase
MAQFVYRMNRPCFDIDELRHAYETVRTMVPPGVSARGQDSMSSISLTHRLGATDPCYDGNQSQFGVDNRKAYEEHEFSVFNEMFKSTYFWDIYSALPFPVGRMRLMILTPAKIYQMHRDATNRAHLAIITNDYCRLVNEDGETFHVPADGYLYIAETRQGHTAFNAGTSERVHLAISMAATEVGAQLNHLHVR